MKPPVKMVTKPPYKVTDDDKSMVERMTSVGITQANVARCLGIDIKTLVKYYREEIDTAWIKANTEIGRSMYDRAIAGDVSAQKYWMSCRAGWKETSVSELAGGLTVQVVKFGDDSNTK